jgi:hypothetical protein
MRGNDAQKIRAVCPRFLIAKSKAELLLCDKLAGISIERRYQDRAQERR